MSITPWESSPDPRAIEAAIHAGLDGDLLCEMVFATEAVADEPYVRTLLGVIRGPHQYDLLRQAAIVVVALAVPNDAGDVERDLVDALVVAAGDDDWWPTQVEALERLHGRLLPVDARRQIAAIAEDQREFELVRASAARLIGSA